MGNAMGNHDVGQLHGRRCTLRNKSTKPACNVGLLDCRHFPGHDKPANGQRCIVTLDSLRRPRDRQRASADRGVRLLNDCGGARYGY